VHDEYDRAEFELAVVPRRLYPGGADTLAADGTTGSRFPMAAIP
jgi:hypothetical protein